MKKITKILSAFVLVFACFAGVFSLGGCTGKKISYISLSNEIKTEYKLGESLDLNGAKLVLTYDDDSQNELTISSDWITGFNTDTVGERALTITYKEKTIEKTYKVVKTLESISLNGTIKTEYKLGESLDLNGAKLVLTYDDDSQNELTISSNWITGFNTDTVGERTLTITYKEKTIEKTYKVVKTLESISLNGTIKTEYKLYDDLDLNNAKITLNYDNSTTEDIVLTSQMITGFNTDTAGNRTLTITYAGKTLPVNYSVSEININTLLTTAYNNTINNEMLLSLNNYDKSSNFSGNMITTIIIKNNNIFKFDNLDVNYENLVNGYICLTPFKTTIPNCEATTNEQVLANYDQGLGYISHIKGSEYINECIVSAENGKYKITLAISDEMAADDFEIIINSDKFIESFKFTETNLENGDSRTTTVNYYYTNVPQISYPEE